MALSKVPDLTHTYRGKDYTFVDQLEDYLKELACPICHCIVSEPLLTSCGHLICKECHNKLGSNRRKLVSSYRAVWSSKSSTQCPVCKQGHTIVPENFIDRRVKNLKVKCINHKQGCDWVGSLGDERQHRMKQDGCQYEEIPCSRRCGVTICRMDQLNHLKRCSKRPHKCEYCGAEGPYQHIVGDHLETCCKYPVQCPNGCKERIPREKAESHTKPLKEEIAALTRKLQTQEQRIRELELQVK